MGKKSLACFVLVQTLIVQIVTAQVQPSLAQYLQLNGLGQVASPVPPAPCSSGLGYANALSYQSPGYQPNPQGLQKTSLPLPLAAIANLAASIPVSNPPSLKPPSVPKPCETLPTTGLDSNVLNNLAIALQLLIVSNILNMPTVETPDPFSKFALNKQSMSRDIIYESLPLASSYPVKSSLTSLQSVPYLEPPRTPSLYSFENQNLPNSNFLGSSGFIQPNIMSSVASVRPNPRSSMTLMSPYEALGPNSPFADPILSTVYSPAYTKNDFKSPYASILAADGNRDMFSMTDLF